jgi:hypothetical protein
MQSRATPAKPGSLPALVFHGALRQGLYVLVYRICVVKSEV